jgi:cysteine synthase
MNHQTRVYDDVFEMLPSEENPSPMVRINRLNPSLVFTLFAKLEWTNPIGSVKDRAAWAMLRDLEERGELGPSRPGRGVVEPTSGNTGLSLAALAGARGYGMRAVVPSKVPGEKKVLLKAAGAELDVVPDALCPLPGSEDGTIGMAKTHAKASADRYVMPNQYENPHNVEAHERTTGPEIWRQTGGRITHLFTSLGTCGTVTGLGRFLKAKNKNIRIIAVQPSPGHDVPGLRNISELDVSKLYDPSLIDEIVEVPYLQAYTRAVDLFRTEGLRAGPSSGLIFEGALRVVKREPAPGLGVMIFPDDLFKYASSLAGHIPALAPE